MRRYSTGARFRSVFVAGLAGAVAVALARRWMHHWGITGDDLVRPLAGDDIVEHPRWQMTLATTIDAGPDLVWPWLAQLGYQRGGLYSYDWLDRLFGILDRPSADRILPQFQGLRTGDVIPLGSGPNWPVALAEPNRTLVIAPNVPGFSVSWAFVLEPVGDGGTRLLTRSRAAFATTPTTALYPLLLDPIAFAMTRRMLLGIKQRAEWLSRTGVGIAMMSKCRSDPDAAGEERDDAVEPDTDVEVASASA